MFNIYTSINKDRGDAGTTGHDRFYQHREHPLPRGSYRRKKRPVTRRAQSATELNSKAICTATVRLKKQRSACTDDEEDVGFSKPSKTGSGPVTMVSSGERTPLLSHSLSKLFSCITLSQNQSTSDKHKATHQGSPQHQQRHGGRYEYTALEADSSTHERLELERKARERAQNACLHYLRSCPRYTLLHHLNDIGSRVDKHWFVVRDSSVKTERLLTLVPLSPNCPIECNPGTRGTIIELFLALQHPYIYPVLDLDFREVGGQTYIVLVLPFNNKGSLKDLIYKSRWQDDWSQKYGQRSTGLPISQVQRLGRQILEALLFLKDRGFPPCSHLHSGNIILQNGVARLTGLENTLLGYTSRIHPVIWSRSRAETPAVDTICFGHVLFEMCAGYELCSPQPSQGHLEDLASYPQVVDVLQFIFQHSDRRYPSVEELLMCDFFRNIDLREMRATPLPQAFQARLNTSTMSLLNEVKKQQNVKRGRRTHSASSVTDSSSPSRRERRSCAEQSSDGDAKVPATLTDNEDAIIMEDNLCSLTEVGSNGSQQHEHPNGLWWLNSPQEHRNLSLHSEENCLTSMETKCLLR